MVCDISQDSECGLISFPVAVGLISAGLAFLIVLCILTFWWFCRRNRSSRNTKRGSLNNSNKDDYDDGLAEKNRYSNVYTPGKGSNVFVIPPNPVPYVDPSPNVKIIRQPNQSGNSSIFFDGDTTIKDKWGTHNVIHIDYTTNEMSEQQDQSLKREELFYRIVPEGTGGNLTDYDYIPIELEVSASSKEKLTSDNHFNHSTNRPVPQPEIIINDQRFSIQLDSGSRYSDQDQLISSSSDNIEEPSSIYRNHRNKRNPTYRHAYHEQ